ncbi:TolB family protein [Caulifigura coniformis]|nr:PD40 domain-containing protein [Caulifigura coniformis]
MTGCSILQAACRAVIWGIDQSGRWAIVLVVLCVSGSGAIQAQEDPAANPRPRGAVYELTVEPPVWKKLFDLPDNYRGNSPRVVGDGRRLAFDAWKKIEGETNSDSVVFMVDLDGKNLKQICRGAMPSPNPDGSRIACSRYAGTSGVWIMNTEGGDGELVDENGWGIQWSPDGASVAYRRGRNVVIRTVATGEERLLFPGAGSPFAVIYWNMSWSPDGRKLAMIAASDPGKDELVIVDTQGAEFGFVRRAAGKFVPSLSWNADKRPLVFPEKGSPYRMLEIDPLGTEEPRLIPGIPADCRATSASWSPDGSRLIVMCNSY